MHLRPAVVPGGHSLGVDDDPECIRFASESVARRLADELADARVRLMRADFGDPDLDLPGGPFHVVTCMMSTLSHFGDDRSSNGDDRLQRVLERLASLVEPDGLLFFSTWSRRACETESFLEIYGPEDRRRLALWTPTEADLLDRLDAAGLAVCERTHPDPLLHLWVCRRGGSA